MSDPARSRAAVEIVRAGWDQASERYRSEEAVSDVFGHGFADHRDWLSPLFEHVPAGASVGDLGCGCGVPDCRLLAERFTVVGVDLSDRQIERARRYVPAATFRRADMTEVEFPEGSLGAVVCLYALIHVPLLRQLPLLRSVRRWLSPGGWLVLIAGERAVEGFEEDWLGSGARMYWSHADAATYRRWLADVGFTAVDERFVPEGSSGHRLFRVRVPP